MGECCSNRSSQFLDEEAAESWGEVRKSDKVIHGHIVTYIFRWFSTLRCLSAPRPRFRIVISIL